MTQKQKVIQLNNLQFSQTCFVSTPKLLGKDFCLDNEMLKAFLLHVCYTRQTIEISEIISISICLCLYTIEI